MKHAVRILRRATSDLAGIQRYIERDSPAAAARVVDALLVAIESLAEHPNRGSLPRDERLQRLGYRLLTRGRHLIFYKVVGKQVRVYRVLHQRRAWARLL